MPTDSFVRQDSSQHVCSIVEFTGITGAGKTTLFHAVQHQLTDAGVKAADAYDVILQSYRLKIHNEKLKSAVVDVLVLLPALRAILTPSGFRLFALACREIFRQARSSAIAIHLLRNVIKRIGVHRFLQTIQQRSADRNLDYDFIFCDEGILHIAHNLFVHTDNCPNLDQVMQFGAIVPKPDLVIWVMADPEQSIQCILERGHDRVGHDRASAKSFVDHAYQTFNTLFQTTDLNERLWRIDCSWSNIPDQSAIYDRAASNITHSLIKILNTPC